MNLSPDGPFLPNPHLLRGFAPLNPGAHRVQTSRRLKLFLVAGCGLILIALGARYLARDIDPIPYRGPEFAQAVAVARVGDKVAPVRMHDLAGQVMTLGAPTDQPVLVHFWASWCAPCVEELPLYQAAYPKLGARGIRLVSIALDDRDHADAVAQARGVTFPVLIPQTGHTSPAVAFGSPAGAVPYTVILDTSGSIVFQRLGTVGSVSDLPAWAHMATGKIEARAPQPSLRSSPGHPAYPAFPPRLPAPHPD